VPPAPHKLDLYRLAVQCPPAEVNFLINCYAHYNAPHWPTHLREDFAGVAAIAATWVDYGHDHRAIAVERHAPTLRRAPKHARLALRCDDVLAVRLPRVDIIAAFNFSAFIYHTREAMLKYLTHARRCLRPGGMLAIDCFGGPGAMRPGIQKRKVRPSRKEGVPAFEYQWEQRSYDPVAARIDCRIHFKHRGRPLMANAFRYDWRLWTLPELTDLMWQAGFDVIDVWCDSYDQALACSNGVYEPVASMPAREDWIAYVVGVLKNG